MHTDEAVQRVFAELGELPGYEGVDLSDIDACAADGENALHYVVRNGDLAAARAPIEAGIDVNKAGDLGYTPLHAACMQDNIDMVRILASKDADLFALSEGYTPSTCARLAGHDEICEWLVPRMEQARTQDPKIWQKARLAQLRREAADLAAQLDGSLAAAKALIDAGISVKQVAALGHVPLHFACIQGNLALVKQLLEKGADLFAMSHGEAPIACARHAGNRRSASCWFVS